MYWKFTYQWWHSVVNSTMFVKADNEAEAYKKFDKQFGYEDVDILKCEETNIEEILKSVVVE